MQNHKQAYLNQIKKRYCRKIRDQGPVSMPKKVALKIAESDMTRTVLVHNYEQFCAEKYKKYRLQFPRMRHSDLINKIIREWEAYSLEQKLAKEFQDDRCCRDSVWSGDDSEAEARIQKKRERREKRRKRKIIMKALKRNAISNRQRIKNFRDSKVRVFVLTSQTCNEDDFRLQQACHAKRPWSIDQQQAIQNRCQQMQDAQEEEIRARMTERMIMVPKKEEKEEISPKKEVREKEKKNQDWERRPNKYAWKNKKSCYPCWKKNFNTALHHCLPKKQIVPYQSITSVVPVPGFISIGRKSSTPVYYESETGIIKGGNAKSMNQVEGKPWFIFFPIKMEAFLPPNLFFPNYWVQTFTNTVRGMQVRLTTVISAEFQDQAKKFPLMDAQKAVQISEFVPQFSQELLESPQKISFPVNFRKGDTFGPIGGQILPLNMLNGRGIPFNREFGLVPIFGATLLSFVAKGKGSNVKMIGATEIADGEAIIYMFFRAKRNIPAFEQIIA